MRSLSPLVRAPRLIPSISIGSKEVKHTLNIGELTSSNLPQHNILTLFNNQIKEFSLLNAAIIKKGIWKIFEISRIVFKLKIFYIKIILNDAQEEEASDFGRMEREALKC